VHHDTPISYTSAQTSALQRLFDRLKRRIDASAADLPPNDFFLFPHIMGKMRGRRFLSPEDAAEAFENHVLKCLNRSGKSASTIG